MRLLQSHGQLEGQLQITGGDLRRMVIVAAPDDHRGSKASMPASELPASLEQMSVENEPATER